jgi:hypothetical protein
MGSPYIVNACLDVAVGSAFPMLDLVVAVFTSKRLRVALPGGVTHPFDDQPGAFAGVDVLEELEKRILGRVVIARTGLGSCAKLGCAHTTIVPRLRRF